VLLAHAQGVGVVKTQDWSDADAALEQGTFQIPFPTEIQVGEDFVTQGPAVLRVEVDFAGDQCDPSDLASPEYTHDGWVAVSLEHLPGDLREDAGLGEVLCADHRRPLGATEGQCQQQER